MQASPLKGYHICHLAVSIYEGRVGVGQYYSLPRLVQLQQTLLSLEITYNKNDNKVCKLVGIFLKLFYFYITVQ